MKMKFFRIMFLCSALLCGCSSNKIQNRAGIFDQELPKYSIDEGRSSTVENTPRSTILQDFKNKNDETAIRARDIAKEVEKAEYVENATAVITGNTAIIGIALKEELSDDRFLDLKHIIEDKVLRFDTKIDHVAITSAPELIKKIVDINGDGENTAKNAEAKNDNDESDVFFRKTPDQK